MVQCKSLDLAVLFTAVLLSGHVHGTAGRQVANTQSANCSTSCGSDKVPCKRLQLMVVLPLHIQPFRETEPKEEEKRGGMAAELPPWDRGLEILPAAYVAADQINTAAGLLPGVELEVVAVNSSLCGQPKGSETSALVEFTREVFKERQSGECLLGVTGLFCDSSAALISSVVTTAHLHLLQLSGSASPSLEVSGGRVSSNSSLLYRMVASSSSYCDAVLALIDNLHWERIAIINEAFASYYTSTADQCYQIINEANLMTTATLDNIVSEAVTSSYIFSNSQVFLLSTSANFAAKLLCSAYTRNMRWPHYAWITYDHTPSDLMAQSTACNSETMRLALNGLIMLRYMLEAGQSADVEATTKLVREYKVEYLDYLRKIESDSDLGHGSLHVNEYANILYDSILAFAYAFNSCSPLLSDQHNIVDSACGRIDNISFQGVSGHIEFNERQVDTPVTLYHYNNESLVTLAHYHNGNLSVVDEAYKSMNLQVRDEIQYILLSVPLVTLLSVIVIFLFLASFVVMVLFIVFRSEPEIKATSSFFSLNLFVGCYLFFTCIIIIVISSSVINSGIAGIMTCQGIIWTGVLGINFILAPLLVRMIRIYHIFHHFGRIGKVCSGWTLLGAMMAIVGFATFIMLLWSVLDPYITIDYEVITCTPSVKQSFYCVVQFCSSEHTGIWFAIVCCEIGMLSFALVVMSVLTRNIKRSNFKDTKKVSTFIFMTIVSVCIHLPLWWVIRYTDDPSARTTVVYFGFGTIAVLCQLLLFVPKVYPALLRCVQGRAPKPHSPASPL